MGNGVGKKGQINPAGQNVKDEEEAFFLTKKGRKMAWPCEERKKLLQNIQKLVKKGDVNGIPHKIKQLREILGMDTPRDNQLVTADNISFLVDDSAHRLVYSLTRAINMRGRHWQEDAHAICHSLIIHISPPKVTGAIPDEKSEEKLEKLTLTSVNLHGKKKLLKRVRSVIQKNESLTTVELAYTGINNEELDIFLPHLAALPNLTYLGLKGNRLENSICLTLLETLRKETSNFKSLMWLDIRNNVDISAVPKSLLDQLLLRWPESGYRPTFRELAEGEALVLGDMMEMDL